jgi:hypothetical protein
MSWWSEIEYFEQDEFDDPLYPGSGKHISYALVHMMDMLRGLTGWPIVVHHAVGGAVDMYGEHGHSDNSYHLFKQGCLAADWHFVTDAPYRRQYQAVEAMQFTGIGIYLNLWKWNGKILPIGFHTDVRPAEKIQRWSCKKKGEYFYLL